MCLITTMSSLYYLFQFFRPRFSKHAEAEYCSQKDEIKCVLEWSLPGFRTNIYFTINSEDGLKHPKLLTTAASNCAASAQATFLWPLIDKWHGFLYLTGCRASQDESKFFLWYILSCHIQFYDLQHFTDLVTPLLLCLQRLGHRQLGCWFVSSCNFLPHHFIVLMPLLCPGCVHAQGWRDKSVRSSKNSRWCQEWNPQAPATPSQGSI